METVQLKAFRSLLAQAGGDHAYLSALPDTMVRVRFLGPFEGREQLWDMTLCTLNRYWADRAGPDRPPHGRLFFEVGEIAEGMRPITVGLSVPSIDEATVRKTIIMVRNYKRLRVGRHEWGEPVVLAAEC
jgi:hypothetical protein